MTLRSDFAGIDAVGFFFKPDTIVSIILAFTDLQVNGKNYCCYMHYVEKPLPI
jgi:hypothetical protein